VCIRVHPWFKGLFLVSWLPAKTLPNKLLSSGPGIKRLAGGSQEHGMSSEIFTQLVDAHYAALYRFALSLARNSADAGDLVQQTFFIWATKGSDLREAAKAKSWLFTTLYREFLRGRRRDSRATSIEDLPAGESEIAAEDVDRVAKCDAATVMTALQGVEETFRAPLTLFYLEDLSYQEIAATLDVPIGTVMSRLSRGKAQLRSVLAREEGASRTKVVPFPSAQGGKTS
jgi:RNA polymerase sigma-70 factor (ECF subfamily)